MKSMMIVLALLVCGAAVSAQNANQVKELRLDRETNRLAISVIPETPPADGLFQVRLTGPDRSAERRTAQGIRASGGLTVALILDTNMKAGRLQAAKSAARDFIGRLNAGDVVTVVGFSDHGVQEGAATQIKSKTLEDMERLQPDHNNRRLRQALYQQSEFIRKAAAGRKALVLVTDGEDDSSSPSLSQDYLIQYCKEMHRQHTEVPLYTITVGKNAETAFYHTLADITDGEDFQAAGTEEIAARFAGVARNLTGSAATYHLEVDGPSRDGAEHTGIVEWHAPGGEMRSVNFRLQANSPIANGSDVEIGSDAPNRSGRQKNASSLWRSPWLLYTGIGLVVAAVILIAFRAGRRPRAVTPPAAASITPGLAVTGISSPAFPPGMPDSIQVGNEDKTLIKSERQDLPTAMGLAARQGDAAPLLLVEKGPHQGLRFEIVSPAAILGRGQNATFQLPNDEQLSRAHAEISRTPRGEIILRDMNSTNGTCVNGILISTPTRLQAGDRLKIGESELVFREVDSQENRDV